MKKMKRPLPPNLLLLALLGLLLHVTTSGATTTTTNKVVSTLPNRGGAVVVNPRAFLRKTLRRRKRDESSKPQPYVGTSSMAASVFNLVNNVAGAGLLALSSGMSSSGTGWIPAITIAIVLGCLSARTFIMIGQACELTQEQDFKGLWSCTMGRDSTWIVDSMIATLCLACSVIYSGILGDVFTPLLSGIGMPDKYNHRTTNILVLTVSLLLPMSLLKNLSALAFTSLLGFASISYTVLFVAVRALDGTYELGTGKYVGAATRSGAALSLLPKFDKMSWNHVDFTSLVLVSNYGLAYVAHYNGPSFYRELKDTNSRKFAVMVCSAFTLLIAMYVATMALGYKTFGDVCKGNLLLNYHPDDVLAVLGRLATGFSILFGFPLVATGAREGLINMFSGLGYPKLGNYHVTLVVSILTIVTFIACTVEDVSLVVGLAGAAMGSAIAYICPSLIYTRAVRQVKGRDSQEYKIARLNLALVPFGVLIAALGVYMTLKGS